MGLVSGLRSNLQLTAYSLKPVSEPDRVLKFIDSRPSFFTLMAVACLKGRGRAVQSRGRRIPSPNRSMLGAGFP